MVLSDTHEVRVSTIRIVKVTLGRTICYIGADEVTLGRTMLHWGGLSYIEAD